MKQKSKMVMNGEYIALLNDIKKKIVSARIKTARSVNKALIQLYWGIGKSITGKQAMHGWGNGVVENLSADLRKEFHNTFGLSVQNLWYMRKFYIVYKDKPILQQLVGELPWEHNIVILSKVIDDKEREYYLRLSAEMGWSRNVLLNQINADAYQLSLKAKQHNFEKALPVHLSEQADESLKSVYNLDFLGVTQPVLERELERRIVEKIKHFILELGSGFSFIGNPYRLENYLWH